MPPEPVLDPSPRRTPRRARTAGAAACLAVAAVLAACGATGRGAVAPTEVAVRDATTGRPSPDCSTALSPPALHALGTDALLQERATLAQPAVTPLQQIRRALLLGQPRNGDLPRALALLNMVLGSTAPEALELRPLAQTLAEQFAERQRLEAVTERLTHQLERTGQQLKDSQKRSEELQEKLDALAEIERKLPARPAAPPLPELPDRRNP